MLETMEMKHYLFCERATGEYFFVGHYDFHSAYVDARRIGAEIAANYGLVAEVDFLDEVTDEEAEEMGYDEY